MTGGFVADLYSLVSTISIVAARIDFVATFAGKALNVRGIGIEVVAVSSIIPID
jgi:hypothetical protein